MSGFNAFMEIDGTPMIETGYNVDATIPNFAIKSARIRLRGFHRKSKVCPRRDLDCGKILAQSSVDGRVSERPMSCEGRTRSDISSGDVTLNVTIDSYHAHGTVGR